MSEISFGLDEFPAEVEVARLFTAAWGRPFARAYQPVLQRSLCHVTARADSRLVGFVNVAWDGGVHAFLLDTCVDPALQRRGIATELVRRAVETAGQRGAEWVHVDYEPHLEAFYAGCGFRPTAAGLVRLR